MKNLEFVFKSDVNKVRILKFNYAKDNMSEAQARDLMKRIANLGMFKKDGVNLYATPVAARYAESQVLPIFNDVKKEIV